MTTPDIIRIGILGAARIAYDGIVEPSRATGCRLTVVAARDAARGRAFADQHGVDRAVTDYRAVVETEDVDVVYNPLPNSMHAAWNTAAIAAGKHVLSEKPFASNAAEAASVRARGLAAGVVVADGLHYRYHPVNRRLQELLRRGDLGELVSVDVVVHIPRPAPGDLRISAALAGGALMDSGCYAIHAIGLVGEIAGPPELADVVGREFPDLPGVDEQVLATFTYPSGGQGRASCWMNAESRELSYTITGTHGSARVENFILPHIDDRLTVTTTRPGRPRSVRVERLGTRSSYIYQLEAFLRAVRYGDPMPTDSGNAVATMKVIDECYRRIGLAPRGDTRRTAE